MSMSRPAVLGAGSWGTTVAALIARKGNAVLWARDPHTSARINDTQCNPTYLPDALLPERLRATSDLTEAVNGADAVLVAVPSQYFRGVLEQAQPHITPGTPVISLSKGLEAGTLLRMSQVISDVLPNSPAGVLSGPNLAREVISGKAAATVVAMQNEAIARQIQSTIGSGLFRVYTNTDITGCELGGVLKNIIAIAVGMGDGRGAGDNTRAALITRGLSEVTRLGVAMGGLPETFAGLAGMGDMIATCTSPQSRNHHVGVELGRGRALDDIIGEMVMVAEGVKSAPTVLQLAQQHRVDMPIVSEVGRVLSGESNASRAFRELLREVAGAESEPG